MKIKANFKWNNDGNLKKLCGLDKDGIVQLHIDNKCIDLLTHSPYVPCKEGNLQASVYREKPGKLKYPGPYAHYMYYGVVYGPNIPIFDDDTGIPTGYYSKKGSTKQNTGRKLKYRTDINSLAKSYWWESVKADHKEEIIKEAKAVAGSRK